MKNKLIKVIMLILSVSSITAFSGVGVTTNVQASQAQTDIDKVSVMQRDIPNKSSFSDANYNGAQSNASLSKEVMLMLYNGLKLAADVIAAIALVMGSMTLAKFVLLGTVEIASLTITASEAVMVGTVAIAAPVATLLLAAVFILVSVVFVSFRNSIAGDSYDGVEETDNLHMIQNFMRDMADAIQSSIDFYTDIIETGLRLLKSGIDDKIKMSKENFDKFHKGITADAKTIKGALDTFKPQKFVKDFQNLDQVPYNYYGEFSAQFGTNIIDFGPKMMVYDEEFNTFRLLSTFTLAHHYAEGFGEISGSAHTFESVDPGNLGDTGNTMLSPKVGVEAAKEVTTILKSGNKKKIFDYIATHMEGISPIFIGEEGTVQNMLDIELEFQAHLKDYIAKLKKITNDDGSVNLKRPDYNLLFKHGDDYLTVTPDGFKAPDGSIINPELVQPGINNSINRTDGYVSVDGKLTKWDKQSGKIVDEYGNEDMRYNGITLTGDEYKQEVLDPLREAGVELDMEVELADEATNEEEDKHSVVYNWHDLVIDEGKNSGIQWDGASNNVDNQIGHTITKHILISDDALKHRALIDNNTVTKNLKVSRMLRYLNNGLYQSEKGIVEIGPNNEMNYNKNGGYTQTPFTIYTEFFIDKDYGLAAKPNGTLSYTFIKHNTTLKLNKNYVKGSNKLRNFIITTSFPQFTGLP